MIQPGTKRRDPRMKVHMIWTVALTVVAIVSMACQVDGDVFIPILVTPISPLAEVPTQTPTLTVEPLPTATPQPDTSDPLYIESLRQYRNASPSEIEIVGIRSKTEAFTRYDIAYLSEGARVSGLMNVPNSHSPDQEGDDTSPAVQPISQLPVILLNHGHYAPSQYRTGLGTEQEADYLAEHGYVTIASDFRGYGHSEGRPGNHFDPSWTYDVLNLLDALPNLDFADPERVGIWGHSTGGEIALQAVTSRDNIDAVVLFASMGANMVDNIPLVVQEFGNVGENALERYGAPEDMPSVWAKLSPITYLAEAAKPIAIHHGDWDEEVPPELSAQLWQAMQDAEIPGEYFAYSGQHHFFSGSDWVLAMERTLAFFDRYVKNDQT